MCIELKTDEALVSHIEGLQSTLTRRNARIAELEERLAQPVDLPEKVEKMIKKAYADGYKECASLLIESTKLAALSLGKIRKDAVKLYIEGAAHDTR